MRRLLGGCALAALVVAATPALAAETHRATVVIDTGVSTRTAIVTFGEDSISGFEALERAGASPVGRDFGGSLGLAVCALDGVGHSAGNDCLGTSGDQRYWSYNRAAPGATSWKYSATGPSNTRVYEGGIEGWRFGTGASPAFPTVTPPLATGADPPALATSPNPESVAPPARATQGAAGLTSTTTAGAAPTVAGATESTAKRNGLAARAGTSTGPGATGSGSPTGVIVVGLLVVALVGTAAVIRRRRAAMRA